MNSGKPVETINLVDAILGLEGAIGTSVLVGP